MSRSESFTKETIIQSLCVSGVPVDRLLAKLCLQEIPVPSKLHAPLSQLDSLVCSTKNTPREHREIVAFRIAQTITMLSTMPLEVSNYSSTKRTQSPCNMECRHQASQLPFSSSSREHHLNLPCASKIGHETALTIANYILPT